MKPVGVHVLHLNLNTTDGVVGQRFYQELLGLQMRMHSHGDDFDWNFHGITEPVSSSAWFFYDDRGPRASPGLELVQWHSPRTAGDAYPSLVHRGMAALRLRAETTRQLLAKAEPFGGVVVGSFGPGEVLLRDPDGVYVEVGQPAATDPPGATRLAGARIGCADLDASLRWYAALGFEETGPAHDSVVVLAGRPMRFRSVAVALPGGTVDLELTQWLDPVADEPAETRLWHRGMVRMAVSVEDLDEAMSTLRERGLEFGDPVTFGMPGTSIDELRVLFLPDPDGFTVELVHRPSRHFRAG